MANDARMTVRLDPTARRKVERLSAREGISLDEVIEADIQAIEQDSVPMLREVVG